MAQFAYSDLGHVVHLIPNSHALSLSALESRPALHIVICLLQIALFALILTLMQPTATPEAKDQQARPSPPAKGPGERSAKPAAKLYELILLTYNRIFFIPSLCLSSFFIHGVYNSQNRVVENWVDTLQKALGTLATACTLFISIMILYLEKFQLVIAPSNYNSLQRSNKPLLMGVIKTLLALMFNFFGAEAESPVSSLRSIKLVMVVSYYLLDLWHVNIDKGHGNFALIRVKNFSTGVAVSGVLLQCLQDHELISRGTKAMLFLVFAPLLVRLSSQLAS